MKTSIFLTAFFLVSLSVFLIYSKMSDNLYGGNNISISISEDDDTYQLKASYNRHSTGRVQQYINHCIEPNSLFKSENDYFDVTTTLTDKTEFYIKESPGKLKIVFDKRKNTSASLARMKNMYTGIKNVLGEK
jgi:hypothetical protein